MPANLNKLEKDFFFFIKNLIGTFDVDLKLASSRRGIFLERTSLPEERRGWQAR